MFMPAQVIPEGGRYRATFVSVPGVVGYGPTPPDAIDALQEEFAARVADGQVIWVNVPTPGDPVYRSPTPEEIEATEEMLAEIYRERDAQKAAEFPE